LPTHFTIYQSRTGQTVRNFLGSDGCFRPEKLCIPAISALHFVKNADNYQIPKLILVTVRKTISVTLWNAVQLSVRFLKIPDALAWVLLQLNQMQGGDPP